MTVERSKRRFLIPIVFTTKSHNTLSLLHFEIQNYLAYARNLQIPAQAPSPHPAPTIQQKRERKGY